MHVRFHEDLVRSQIMEYRIIIIGEFEKTWKKSVCDRNPSFRRFVLRKNTKDAIWSHAVSITAAVKIKRKKSIV